MCCFSIATAPSRLFGLFRRAPKLEVSGTRIFARVADGVEWLVYSMSIATSSDVAMVLPLPVARVADDALRFIDLSGVPTLFDQLEELFMLASPQSMTAPRGGGFRLPRPKLVVHRVGAFEASYVPSLADMDCLDERFRIPETVWHQRVVYAGYGFAVFKLHKAAKQRIHPMAMRFETTEPSSIYFPTVHVHDGTLHDTAAFDHTLFYQAPDDATRATGPTDAEALRARRPVASAVSVAASQGVIDPAATLFRCDLHGRLPNTDARVSLG